MAGRAILKVLWGKAASQKIVIGRGETVRVGRDEEADLCLAHDRKLSSIHFSVDFTGTMIRVRDAASHSGTMVNGERFASGVVDSGAVILAGETVFRVFKERGTPPFNVDQTPARVAAASAALAILKTQPSLYGVFDAARDPRILSIIDESVDEAWSLYEGPAGDALADVAPYLVRFRSDSDLLDRLVGEGWGLSWGIYFEANRPLREVRRHFRRFLMVETDQSRERMYFRFYDPRVLREFLPVTTPRQRSEFFGDVAMFLFEDAEATLRRVDPLALDNEGDDEITADAGPLGSIARLPNR